MQTVETNRGASEPSAKKVSSAPQFIVSSEEKNFSERTKPFQDAKVGDQPCLSRLPAMDYRMQRGPHSQPAQVPPPGPDLLRDKIEDFRQTLMYLVPSAVREQAIDVLTMLIRFDDALSSQDAELLCDAVKVIHRADGVQI